MSSFLLAMNDNILDINSLNLENGYSIDKDDEIITIYDDNLKQKYVKNKFIKLYIFVVKRIQSILDDNPDDDGFKKCISELDRLENILKGEYIKYLKATEYEYFLKDMELVKETLLESYNDFKKRKTMRR